MSTWRSVEKKGQRILSNNGDGSCEYCRGLRDPKSSDNPDKAVISLQNDRGTSYDMYIRVQNELVAAYNELRNELAQRLYGKDFKDCGPDAQKFIKDVYPQKLSEAEPVNLG